MNELRFPGFSAEASLKAGQSYRMAGGPAGSHSGLVVPQWHMIIQNCTGQYGVNLRCDGPLILCNDSGCRNLTPSQI
jgi:hypothetical protein